MVVFKPSFKIRNKVEKIMKGEDRPSASFEILLNFFSNVYGCGVSLRRNLYNSGLLKIEKLRKEIEKKYTDVLPTWTGDMEYLQGTQEMIEGLLYSTGGSPREEEKQTTSVDISEEIPEIAAEDKEFNALEDDEIIENK